MDVLNENYECDSIYNGHDVHIYGAIGGRINDDFVFCGGLRGIHRNNKTLLNHCYVLGQESPIENIKWQLSSPFAHNHNSGVVLPNNTLFLTG